MSLDIILSQIAVLFFGIFVGYLAMKLKVVDAQGCKVVTNLVMNVTLPFFIVSSGLTSAQTLSPLQVLQLFCISSLCYLIAYAIGLALSRLPCFEKRDRRLCSFLTTFGNTGFMGLPFIAGIFGKDALLYATIFNLPNNILMFSMGTYLVSADAPKVRIQGKTFLNACFISSVLAIVLYLLGIHLPQLVCSCLDTVGSASVPLAMLVTGAKLAEQEVRAVMTDIGAYVLACAKNLAVPLAAFLVFSLVVWDGELIAIGTLLMAMPCATNSTMLCLQYGGNEKMASRNVFLSTLLSVATIPLVVLVLG